MKTSNLATPLQILDHGLKRQVRLRGSLLEHGEILGVFSQGELDGFVDDVGQTTIRLRGLESERTVEGWIEIHGR